MTNITPLNPWHNLPAVPNYILPEDLVSIRNHRNFSNLHLETLPGQFIGGLNSAEVVFLLLNPGFEQRDIDVNLSLPEFKEDNQRNHIDPYNSPFYYFNKGYEQTGGYVWWARMFKSLLKAGVSESVIRTKVMAIEYFPYHSVKYKSTHIIPSQQFAFDLVSEAIERKKTIVIMRSKRLWFEAVPSLEDYENKMIIKNPRAPYVSSKNLGEVNFNAILSKLID
jgi:hypothetical protein